MHSNGARFTSQEALMRYKHGLKQRVREARLGSFSPDVRGMNKLLDYIVD